MTLAVCFGPCPVWNKFGVNDMPPLLNGKTDKHLAVFPSNENAIMTKCPTPFKEMLPADIIVLFPPPPSPLCQQIASCWSLTFKILTFHSRAPTAICMQPSLYIIVHRLLALFPGWKYGFFAAILQSRQLLVGLLWTTDGSTWFPLDSDSSMLMALLNSFRCWRAVTMNDFH